MKQKKEQQHPYACGKKTEKRTPFFKGCQEGWYGFDCNETCGHCRDLDQCLHVNGTCSTGCESGFQNELCKTREWMAII